MEELVGKGLEPAITGCLSALSSVHFVEYLNLGMPFAEDGELIDVGGAVTATITSVWRFAVSLAGALSVTQAKYLVPPRCFLGLLSESSKQATLQSLKKTFEAIERLESVDSRSARKAVSDMEWPNQTWTRENFSFLAETQFCDVPDWLQADLRAYAVSHNTTLMLENLFNTARRAVKANPRGRLDPKGLWHAVGVADKTNREFDRPTVPITATAAKACGAAAKVRADLFSPSIDLVSLSSEMQESLTSVRPSWPNHSAKFHKEASLSTMNLKRTKGDFTMMRQAWFSLLLVPGSYVSDSQGAWLVLYVSRHGFVGLRCGLITERSEQKTDVFLNFETWCDSPVVYKAVYDTSRWRATDVMPVLPTLSCPHLRFKLVGKGRGLVKFSLLRGAPKMTVFFLKELLKSLQESVPTSPTEVRVLEAVAQAVFRQEYSPELLQKILSARHSVHEDSQILDQSCDSELNQK
jgi:hypothetical protein